VNILTVDCYFEHDKSTDCSFKSTSTFLDNDVIIWDPNFSLSNYEADRIHSTYKGLKNLNEHDSSLIRQDIKRRKVEIQEVLKLGRTVIIFMSPNQKFFYDTGEREYSGTGKNRQTTSIVNEIDLLSVLPNEINVIPSKGSNIDCRVSGPFKSFFNSNKDHFTYEAYFNKPIGTPIYSIKGTNKAVGSYLIIENGHLIFLPTFVDEDDEKLQNSFIESVITLVNELKKETGDFEQPLWSNNFLLPGEEENNKELEALQVELDSILDRINKQKEILSKIEEYKILFTGTGKSLEIMVNRVFEELGFVVTDGIPGRDDLILKYKEQVAVVEIKGVSKSAAEKHAAQLEKWVSEYFSNFELMPKGILLVNAFKDTPLNERSEEFFPDQMISYCEKRNHCLISGLQLLCIYFDCLNNPDKKDEIISEIFSTSGKYNGYNDWSQYLSQNISSMPLTIK
jgi:hypothetical protein